MKVLSPEHSVGQTLLQLQYLVQSNLTQVFVFFLFSKLYFSYRILWHCFAFFCSKTSTLQQPQRPTVLSPSLVLRLLLQLLTARAKYYKYRTVLDTGMFVEMSMLGVSIDVARGWDVYKSRRKMRRCKMKIKRKGKALMMVTCIIHVQQSGNKTRNSEWGKILTHCGTGKNIIFPGGKMKYSDQKDLWVRKEANNS